MLTPSPHPPSPPTRPSEYVERDRRLARERFGRWLRSFDLAGLSADGMSHPQVTHVQTANILRKIINFLSDVENLYELLGLWNLMTPGERMVREPLPSVSRSGIGWAATWASKIDPALQDREVVERLRTAAIEKGVETVDRFASDVMAMLIAGSPAPARLVEPFFDSRVARICDYDLDYSGLTARRLPSGGGGIMLPEVSTNLTCLDHVRMEILPEYLSPCFPLTLECGFIDAKEAPKGTPLYVDPVRDAECRRKLEEATVFSGRKLFAPISDEYPYVPPPGTTHAYSLEEAAPVGLSTALAEAARAGNILGALRSILFQVAHATEAMQTIDMVHGELTVDHVRLKRLPAHAGRGWLFRGTAKWKRVPPEDHLGYLVKIRDFERATVGKVASVTARHSEHVDPASPKRDAYARTFDLGVFCLSLALLLSKKREFREHIDRGGESLRDKIFRFMDIFGHSGQMLIRLTSDKQARESIARRPLSASNEATVSRYARGLSDRVTPVLWNMIAETWSEAATVHKMKGLVLEWAADTFAQDHFSEIGSVIHLDADRCDLFADYDVENDAEPAGGRGPSVAMSTKRPLGENVTCPMCNGTPSSEHETCSTTCRSVRDGSMLVATPLEILAQERVAAAVPAWKPFLPTVVVAPILPTVVSVTPAPAPAPAPAKPILPTRIVSVTPPAPPPSPVVPPPPPTIVSPPPFLPLPSLAPRRLFPIVRDAPPPPPQLRPPPLFPILRFGMPPPPLEQYSPQPLEPLFQLTEMGEGELLTSSQHGIRPARSEHVVS